MSVELLSAAERRVFHSLPVGNGDGSDDALTVREVAETAGVARSTATRALHTLEFLGMAICGSGHRGAATYYRPWAP